MRRLLFSAWLFLTPYLLFSQNIGIGITNPSFKLHVGNGTVRIEGPGSPGDAALSLGGYGTITIDAPFMPGGRFSMSEDGSTYFVGNIGIRSSSTYPLTLPSELGDKISLWGTAGAHYGLGIQSGLLQIHTDGSPSDIAFGYGTSASFTETMRVKGNGNVGIGTSSPATKLEATHNGASTFGTVLLLNQTAIGNSDGPKIQFRKTMNSPKSWTTGIINGVDNGSFSINEDGGTSGFGTTRFAIAPGGNVGIGITNPAFLLDVGGRMRIRSGGGSAGMYLNSNDNTQSPAFIGMQDDTHVGFWGNGSQWNFTMNTNTGAFRINGSEGNPGQVLQSNGSGSPTWSNKAYVLYYNGGMAQLNGSATSVNIPNINGQVITISQASYLTYQYTVSIGGDNGSFGGGSKCMVNIQLLNGSGSVVSNASTQFLAANLSSAQTFVIGIADLPAGSYTVVARIVRDGSGDGHVYINAGSYAGVAIQNQLMLQVFPR